MTFRATIATQVPRRAVPQQVIVFQNLLQNTLKPAAAQTPFNQFDWQNPIRSVPSMARHFCETTFYFTPPPIVPLDWQLPVRARKVQQPDISPTNLLQTTLYSTPPVPQFTREFRNPVLARRVQEPYLFPDLLTSTLFVADSTPDQFVFIDVSGQALNTTIISAAVTISGINVPVLFTATGGLIDKNGDANFQTTQTLSSGDTMRASVLSSGSYLTAADCTVSAGGVSDIFTATTLAAATTGVGSSGGGGGGLIPRRPQVRHKPAKKLNDLLNDVVAEVLYKDAVKAEPSAAAAIVKPFAETRAAVPAVAAVDWKALEADADRFGQLLALHQKIEAQKARDKQMADEDDWLMMGD